MIVILSALYPEPKPVLSEDHELPYFIIGDVITIQTGVLNTGEVAISESHVTSYLIPPSGANIKTGEYVDHHTIPPGDGLYVEIIWDSAGAQEGVYGMLLEGTCIFTNEESGELYNLQEEAFVLYEEEPVFDFSLSNFRGLGNNYVVGKHLQCDSETTITNTGNVDIMKIEYKVEVYKGGVKIAEDTGTIRSSAGIFMAPGDVDYIYGSHLSDNFTDGTYIGRITVTATADNGKTLTKELTNEALYIWEASNLDFSINSIAALQAKYVYGVDPQADVETEVTNTGNIVITQFDYELQLYRDGIKAAKGDSTVSWSSGGLQPGDTDYLYNSFLLDGFLAGNFDGVLTVTATGENGEKVTKEYTSEQLFEYVGPNLDFSLTNMVPLKKTPYVVGKDLECDAETTITNTGNVPIMEVNYKYEIFKGGVKVIEDSGTIRSSAGVFMAPGDVDYIYGGFLSDPFTEGGYSGKLTVTVKGDNGEYLTKELVNEGLFTWEAPRVDFTLSDIHPLKSRYVVGVDLQCDAEAKIQNTGNVDIEEVEYKWEIFKDGVKVGEDSGTLSSSAGSFLEVGGVDYFYGAWLPDDFTAGTYLGRLTVTCKGVAGEPVTKEVVSEQLLVFEDPRLDFSIHYLNALESPYPHDALEVSAECEITNTGNLGILSVDYKCEIFKDGVKMGTSEGMVSTSSGVFMAPGETSYIYPSFLTDDLTPGDYSGVITLTATGTNDETVTHTFTNENLFTIQSGNLDFSLNDIEVFDPETSGNQVSVTVAAEIENTGDVTITGFTYTMTVSTASGLVAEIEGTEPFPGGLQPGDVNDLVDDLVSNTVPRGDLIFKVEATATGDDGRTVSQELSINYVLENESGGIPGFGVSSMILGLALLILVTRSQKTNSTST